MDITENAVDISANPAAITENAVDISENKIAILSIKASFQTVI